MSEKNRVYIFDTTMRDGEQSPGASMSLEEKIQISRVFDEMGIDIIEAGFPIASDGDFEAVRAIACKTKVASICGLARANFSDIDRCWEAVRLARRPRIHTFIGTSPLHRAIPNLTMDEMAEKINQTVTYARNLCDDVQWSPMDATRTEQDYLCRVIEIAIKAGATTINIPDTVGYTVPSEFTKIIQTLMNKVPNIDKAILSVHCHNDLGLAVANSLAGVSAGARQVECTINGIGERAGNASLEEIVMAIKTRNDLMPYETGINTTLLSKASKVVSNATFPVQFNKAIVGKNAFAHEAGIHQDGMLKNRETYEIMTPESVGVKQTSLVMGKHSGRHAFKEKLTDLGYVDVTDDVIQTAFGKFKVLADKKKVVYDDDILALVDDSLIKEDNVITLKSLKVIAGTGGPQKADMTLDIYGEIKQASETGDGPVDATFKCIKKLYPHDVKLQLYQVHAVTEGTDAQATVSVRIEENGKTTVGQAADTDTLVASANAYINALNNFQDHGVIVYALSNTSSYTDADFQAALPELFSQLDEAWITAVNVEITGSSGNETYTRKSAPCGSTGAYCLGGDGFQVSGAGGAQNGVSSYWETNHSGTSFVAPQISGAVALLAEAFPNHTPEQITDRLLASADNSFFNHDAVVTFGNGVKHGYDDEFGHGILDIYAALNPITTSAYTRIYTGKSTKVGEEYQLGDSKLLTSNSLGDSLQRGLIGEVGFTYDDLGGGFKYDMSYHVELLPKKGPLINLSSELASLSNPLITTASLSSPKKIDTSITVGNSSLPVQSFFNSNIEFFPILLESISIKSTPLVSRPKVFLKLKSKSDCSSLINNLS